MYQKYKAKLFIRLLLASITLVVLAACSNVAPPVAAPSLPDTNQAEFAYVASVDISRSVTQAEVEAQYGGQAVVFRPEAGFAVLGFETSNTLVTLSDNQDTYSAPVVQAAGMDGSGHGAWSGGHGAWSGGHGAWSGGWDAWAGGHGAWSGGHGAWSGGHGAWSGGHGAWAGGELYGTPMDNYGKWVQIGLPEAHLALAPKLGEGVTVAVIDTGVDGSHPVLVDNMVPGWDFVDNDADASEGAGGGGYGHGTAVAGIILQVAPKASIMPLRTLDANGYGDTDDVTEAVNFAVEHGADVINLSLGSVEDDEVLETIMEYATEAGIYVIASVGNEGQRDRVTFPARRGRQGSVLGQRLVGVGSVDMGDIKSGFSNYGKSLEVIAPGESVFTLYPDNRITYASGTSFASPMVAGALALGLAENIHLNYRIDLADLMGENTDEVDSLPGNKPYEKLLGKGRLDVTSFLRGIEAVDYSDSFTVEAQDTWDLDFAYKLGDVKLRVYPDSSSYNHQYIRSDSIMLHAGSGKLVRPYEVKVGSSYTELLFKDQNPQLLALFEDQNIQPDTVQTLTLSFGIGSEDIKGYDVPVLFEDGDKRWVNYDGGFFVEAQNKWEMKFYNDDGEVKFRLYDTTEDGYNGLHVRPDSVVLRSERGQVRPTEVKPNENYSEAIFKDLKPQLIDLIANPAKSQSYALTMSFAIGDGPVKDYPVTVTFKD